MTLSEIKTDLENQIKTASAKHGGNSELSRQLGMERSYVATALGSNSFGYLTKCLKKIEQLDKNALTN